MTATTTGILVLDTGYSGLPSDPRIQVVPKDFCPPLEPFAGIRPGYSPRLDGSDSVPDGHGTRVCRAILDALKGVQGNYAVRSVKVGDSSSPYAGVTTTAIQPALFWVCRLPAAWPTVRWVCFLNWDVTAVAQAAPCLEPLHRAGIPLVLPAGEHTDDLETIVSGGVRVGSYLRPHVLVASSLAPGHDFGVKTVDLAVDRPDGSFAAAMAAAWVAVARHAMPDAPPDAVVARVKAMVTPDPRAAGRTVTGGVLAGVPR